MSVAWRQQQVLTAAELMASSGATHPVTGGEFSAERLGLDATTVYGWLHTYMIDGLTTFWVDDPDGKHKSNRHARDPTDKAKTDTGGTLAWLLGIRAVEGLERAHRLASARLLSGNGHDHPISRELEARSLHPRGCPKDRFRPHGEESLIHVCLALLPRPQQKGSLSSARSRRGLP